MFPFLILFLLLSDKPKGGEGNANIKWKALDILMKEPILQLKMTFREQSKEREKKEIQHPSRKSVVHQENHSSHYTLLGSGLLYRLFAISIKMTILSSLA